MPGGQAAGSVHRPGRASPLRGRSADESRWEAGVTALPVLLAASRTPLRLFYVTAPSSRRRRMHPALQGPGPLEDGVHDPRPAGVLAAAAAGAEYLPIDAAG